MGAPKVCQPYERFAAVFRPRVTDDLVEGAAAYIGRGGVFEACWRIEEGQPYAGEWAMKIPCGWDFGGAFCVPEGDLEVLCKDTHGASCVIVLGSSIAIGTPGAPPDLCNRAGDVAA